MSASPASAPSAAPVASVPAPAAVAAPTGLYAVLREVVARMQRLSGADILTLYLYDAATRGYYAPVAVGLPEDGLLGSIADLREQLARYEADAAQGKAPAPDELRPNQYGPNVWLTVTRRPLVARDAPAEIDSSFIRRFSIEAIVGLPLLAGENLVGLLYLDFCTPSGRGRRKSAPPDDERVAELEREAAAAAVAIERARQAEERAAFAVVGELAAGLGTPAAAAPDGDGVRRQVVDALAVLLGAAGIAAGAVYRTGAGRGRLELVGELGLPGAPAALDLPEELRDAPAGPADAATLGAAEAALGVAGLRAVAAYPLRHADQTRGWLLALDPDRLALLRRAPATGQLFGTAADLLAGALASQRLIATLEDTNQVLGALSRLGSALLQPGATRQGVLDAVVRHLTDPAVPEFAFGVAAVYLLEDAGADDGVSVRMAAGAATPEVLGAAPAPPAAPRAAGTAALGVPSWVQIPNRALAADDVLVAVARRRQAVVVGGAADGARGGGADGEVVTGYPPDAIHRRSVAAVRADGRDGATVPVVVVNGAGPGHEPPAAPFTLDGDLFEAHGHGDLVRVFVPFGLDPTGPATGVLEAGYHRAHRRRLGRTQIEALRAGAAQVAVAVETARLYEDVKRQADQLEIATDVSKAIAASIDLEQTLRVVARNMTRLVDASLCQIALYEDEGSAWQGAAASDDEETWRRQRGERPEDSFLFEVLDRRAPLVIEDAGANDLVPPYYARRFGVRSLLALPLIAGDQAIGAAILAQRDRPRRFTPDEVQRALGLANQAAIALQNARQHAFAQEEHHIQKDVVLLGFGEWGQKAYKHLLALKQFYNFKTHVVAPDRGEESHRKLAGPREDVLAHGDAFYWDKPEQPAREQLRRALESSCYVVTYIATPAATHLPVLAEYYDVSNVVVIEKPLGAPPEAYRAFLDSVEGGVELIAADHYYFKLEVRLLQLLLTEERTLRDFVDNVEEIELELLEERALTGAAGAIGIIADMVPHAFAIVSLFTPIDRIRWSTEGAPLAIGRQEPIGGEKETYARLVASFPHKGRQVRLVITVGKGVENAKWIKLSGDRRVGARRSFYKFDFGRGEAIDGTQTNLRAAVRPIREPGVPDTAHLTMLRHVIEKRHPAVGILAIREAMRSNQRIQELEAMADELLARGEWTPYTQGQRPEFTPHPLHAPVPDVLDDAREAAGRVG